MDKLKEEISKIIDGFAKQEFGNRLSEFALMGLKLAILEKISSMSPKESYEDRGVQG